VGSWNLGGVERSRRIPARSAAGGSMVARGKKRKSSGEMGFGSGFIGEHGLVEERERERGQSRGWAQDGGRCRRALRVRGSRLALAARRG
jgi:hypothetical protein